MKNRLILLALITIRKYFCSGPRLKNHHEGYFIDDLISFAEKPVPELKNRIFPISASCLSLSFLLLPNKQIHSTNGENPTANLSFIKKIPLPVDSLPVLTTTDESNALYDSLQLKRAGLTKEAFDFAWKGYNTLIEKNYIRRKGVLTICDFSQSSRRKRMYLVDVENCKLLLQTYVAHGRNSGNEYAKKFSNKPESLQSSLGFFVTRSTYYGSHGLALTIDGVETGINDKAERRKIVVHGSEYVGANYLRFSKYMGRSFGCPAVPAKQTRTIINTIKNGTCFFIYHPSKKYKETSTILND